MCSVDSVSVVRCAVDGQLLASDGAVTAAQIASGDWQGAVAALQLSPLATGPAAEAQPEATTAQRTGGGPSTPSSSAADAASSHPPASAAAGTGGVSVALPAEVQAAAERAAAIVAEFEHVFSSVELLQAIGRQPTAGSEVCRQLFQGAVAGIRSHYGLSSAAAASSGGSLQALLALAGGCPGHYLLQAGAAAAK